MSLKLTVTNNYYEDLQAHDVSSTKIKPDETKEFEDVFISTKLDVYGLGNVNLLDIQEKQISGASKKKLGYLISYQGDEVEYRYEEKGELELTITDLGQCSLKGVGDFIRVRISSFEIPKY